MKRIIITLTNEAKSFSLDIETNSDITAGEFKSDLYDALGVYDPDLRIGYPGEFDIICPRLDKILDDSLTLSEQGVWNGDYLRTAAKPQEV